jgi:hypothetical protein
MQPVTEQRRRAAFSCKSTGEKRTRTVFGAADQLHARLMHRLDGHAQQLVRIFLPPVLEVLGETSQLPVDLRRFVQPARELQALARMLLHQAEGARAQRACASPPGPVEAQSVQRAPLHR